MMECLKETEVLKFHPDTLQAIRKLYGLDSPGAMNDAIDILHEWVKKQDHFIKKDFDRDYLERVIVRTKGSIERSKLRLDKICTARTLMPALFVNCNVKELPLLDIVEDALLPRLTQDYYRVYFLRNVGQEFDKEFHPNYFRRVLYFLEYMYKIDYVAGIVLVFDFRQMNHVAHLRSLPMVEVQQFLVMLIECYGLRMKGIHMISTSKVVHTLAGIFKQFLTAKIESRIHIHDTLESLYEHVEKDILPKEYGGSEVSLSELHQKLRDIASSEKHMEYMKMMNAAGTNEAFRRTDKYNEQVLGMPGSFRALRVD
ncbi:hypothetical protein ABMA28_008828 [Loxostege sticticalis]|uniref:CRAL-TRIO domain-containing protein n=1 Tax=Loxostege sticticalis TaxID=481309 RepID=A0ABD0SES2_LOXSC